MTNLATRRFLMGGLLTLALAAAATACNVPVFRYALERWQPDPYEVIVFHRGPFSPADKALITKLENAADGKSVLANVQPYLVDLDKEKDKRLLELYAAQKDAVLPWAVVRYPEGNRGMAGSFAGRLDDSFVQTLLDSPVRRQVVKRLVGGDTAVWVLLESGDKDRDNAAAELLQAQAKELPKVLKLPAVTDDPADVLLTKDELRIAFSLIRLSRTDPAEKPFVDMLLNTEKDLADLKDPMVFTVFGRGRTLLAMVGKGITKDLIAQDAHFLVGPCSCEVKRQNPGVDLLMAADWEAQLEKRQVKEPVIPELTGLSDFLDPRTLPAERLSVMPREVVEPTEVQSAVTKPAPVEPFETKEAPKATNMLLFYVLGGAAAGLVVLMVVALLFLGKK